jgi:hypothetical protein
MGSTVVARHLVRSVLSGCLLAAALAGCGSRSAPEDELRAVMAQAEAAAEHRDAADLLNLVAADYRDDRGNDAGEIRRYLRGFLIANQSIHLLSRIDDIEIMGEGVARVRATVGMLGRDAAAGGDADWDLAGSVYEFDLTFARDDGEWRVTSADWQPALRR